MRQRRRVRSEEELRQEASINAELTALAKHPSWHVLEEEVVRKRAKIERYLTRKVLLTPAPVNQREVDLLRGVIEGMSWLVDRPRNAEVGLERYLAEHANVDIGEE